ncbi:carbon-nitrogen hydrolase family protein [Cognataquiflexum rubidum]|uniref:carbon-nitrogen hydrolase family protein n=1 Tax=Cognataquiflexum rubidum TaxID=2922273 RepID=UPI001F13B9C6|nr:carbon-nitrogen hydrolase family protein [Cognataquiflexum rubidum]MCH6233386.1 carbon-nitrogen hydrolase family protein [Cognataquiflexum rubidum]
MKIGVAQIRPIKGDISDNILKHILLVSIASDYGVSAIFFSELSLSGYEPELASDLATDQSDKRFDVIQAICNKNSITVGVGIPTKTQSGIQISMVIFQPNKTRITYSKQQIHSDEFPYFECGEKQIILTIDNKKIAPAICYESLQTSHSDNAVILGAEIYIASVAKSQMGIEKGKIHYPAIAKKFAIPVLMSNCVGFCDNFESAGQSSVWTKQGSLAGQLDNKNEGILIFNTETEVVIKHTI